jgi:hypothetical protein
MSFAERLARWNQWYDRTPETWRFQIVLWPLLVLGAINMALTISAGVPFALFVVLGILVIACIRVPYVLGWVTVAAEGADPTPATIRIVAYPWVYGINQWYDGLPEFRRPMVTLGVLLIAGAINMALTIHHGFSFGILFLLTMLALVLIRGPYAAGWLVAPPGHAGLAVAHPSGRIASESVSGAPGSTVPPLPVTHEPPPPPPGDTYH